MMISLYGLCVCVRYCDYGSGSVLQTNDDYLCVWYTYLSLSLYIYIYIYIYYVLLVRT